MRRVVPAVLSTLLAAGLLLAGPPATAETTAAAAAQPAAAASTFTPLSPVRVLDTRIGTGGVTGPVGGGGTVTLSLASRVPASATAVVLNVTGVDSTAGTHVIVFPAGITRPTTSSLNLPPGDTRPNQVTVTLGTNRAVSIYNNAGNLHLVADLAGYYSTGSGAKFTPLSPVRALDTRLTGGPVGGGGVRVVDLTGRIPASATSVTFNLTATNPTAGTFVTAFPTGTSVPTASNLNVPPGDTRPNLVTVAVGADRKVSLYNNVGTVDLVVDVTGFYTPEYGNHFVPFNPQRVLDTRNGAGPFGHQEHRLLDLPDDLPVNVTGVALNLTGVDATAPTFVTVWPAAGDVPNASTLNLAPGQTAANAAVVPTIGMSELSVYNNNGSVHLIADLAGVFGVVDDSPCTTDCVYAWGGTESTRPIGDTSPLSKPTRMVALSGVRAVDGTLALREDGTVWSWGHNYSGQLGNGTRDDSSVPVRVTGLTDVVAIAAGEGVGFAVRADGTVWAWGFDGGGNLGTGTTAEDSTTPIQVVGLGEITTVASGDSANYALRADGTVWSWGYGPLGHGQPCVPGQDCSTNVPAQVAGLTDVTAIDGGRYNGRALRADGTVWSWGLNYDGQLGDGVECDPFQPCGSDVPVQTVNLTDVTQIGSVYSGGYALRADGTVWSWGRGALGTDAVPEDRVTRVPVQVQVPSGVSAIGNGPGGGYAIVP